MHIPPIRFSRRRFVQGLAGGAFLLGARPLTANTAATPVLSGTEFDLSMGEIPVNFTGQPRIATVINGTLPAPTLKWREGDTVTLRVTNRLSVPGSIHWHGLVLPANMDGVPGLSFDGIAPGHTFTYRFKVNQSGTYWYHSHSRFLEQTGLYGAIVVEPRQGERQRVDRDYVILLSDWTDTDPEHIFATLKKHSDYFNFNKRTVGDFRRDARAQGFKAAMQDRRRWGQMRMDPTDIADIGGYAYTYLMNGCTPAANWSGLFQRGEKIRLRFINGSSMSIFDVRIPGLKLTVIAADGQEVEPISVDEFRIGTAEVYDVIVQPADDRPYTIFAQSMDRSGYARGTLTPHPGLQTDVPPLDPRPLLTMRDMGMAHDGAHADPADHAHHAAMGHHLATQPALQHAATEYSPGVDMRAEQVRTALDDPGVGLRDNGRRVLTYADLHTLGGPIDPREPGRTIELHLTGHMQRYMWSFNGQKFSQAAPLRFNYGERLRISLVNDTMMTHPIHLHGMWSEIENPRGEFQVRKHTLMVQPAQRVNYAVTADALGRWAFHCHLLYHMEAGMFREVQVLPADATNETEHSHDAHQGHR